MKHYKVERPLDLCEWTHHSLGEAIGMIAGFYAEGSQKVAILIDPFIERKCEVTVIWMLNDKPYEYKYIITLL